MWGSQWYGGNGLLSFFASEHKNSAEWDSRRQDLSCPRPAPGRSVVANVVLAGDGGVKQSLPQG
jgi:hypothetical protein